MNNDGVVPWRMDCNTILMIPKPGKEKMRGIGLTEESWKIYGNVIKERITEKL